MAKSTVKTTSGKDAAPAPAAPAAGKKQAAPATAAPAPAQGAWHMFDDLRREVDRLFEDFGRSGWLRPARSAARGLEPAFRRQFAWGAPAVDIAEKDKAYEITAELPGLSESDIDVFVRNGSIVIKGEKQEEKEEKAKDYYVQERRFGSFQRAFAMPAGVDEGRIDASFRNGVLTVTLPKTAAAQQPEKKIKVKGG